MEFRQPALRRLHLLAFLGCLASILYLSLRPEPASRTLGRFSTVFGLWEGGHDNWSNFIAFFVLSSLGFWLPASPGFWARAGRRCLCFLALVAAIEVAQIWIPNRVSDLRDVMAGWTGIFAAFLVWLGFRRFVLHDK